MYTVTAPAATHSTSSEQHFGRIETANRATTPLDDDDTEIFVLATINNNPTYSDPKVPLEASPWRWPTSHAIMLSGMVNYYDKNQKAFRRRMMFYDESQESLWLDEQLNPNGQKRSTRELDTKDAYVRFETGALRLSKSMDAKKIEALKLHESNGSNKDRLGRKAPAFYHLRVPELVENANTHNKTLMDALNWVYRTGSEAEKRAIAWRNGIKSLNIADVEWHLSGLVQKNPQAFMAEVGDPKMRVQANIMLAIDSGRIRIEGQTARFVSTGREIGSAPVGTPSVMDWLCDQVIKGVSAYTVFYEELSQMMEGTHKTQSADSADEDNFSNADAERLETILREKKLLRASKPGANPVYAFYDTGGTMLLGDIKGKVGPVTALMENKILREKCLLLAAAELQD
jgi:hypothetical protein